MKDLRKYLLILASIILSQSISLQAATYYLCAESGNDANDGLSQQAAWKSLEQANSVVFQPGDSLLIASGSVFKGQLALKGSGAIQDGKMLPIRLDSYGKGALPRIDGEGKVTAPLFLHNVEGWEIQNIELTNTGGTRKKHRFGLYVLIDNMPAGRHFVIRNVIVRDVNGNIAKLGDDIDAAGIRVNALLAKGDVKGRRLENVLIEDCKVRNCERNAIVVSGTKIRDIWNPSTGIVIRGNLIEGVGGDGILVMGCDGALVEWNIMRDCTELGTEVEAAAGMWPFSSDNSVFQFNEVVGHSALKDGQAYDCDYNCNNTLFQYNLSRDNQGGFMLICSPGTNYPYDSWNRGSVVRFNLSINDGSRTEGFEERYNYRSATFHLTGNSSQNSEIYSNLLIIPKKPDPKMDTDLFWMDDWGGKFPVNTKVRDNVFVLLDGQPGTFSFNKAKQVLFENNRFYGNVTEIKETKEIKSIGNQYIKEKPCKVIITGTAEELTTFAGFLALKGNPQQAAGITIDWKVK